MKIYTSDALDPTYEPERISFKQHVADFANIFKAFIGANYLTISFAFKQSGLWLGIGALFVIAGLTDFCCHLIIKCKYAAMKKLMINAASSAAAEGASFDDDEMQALFDRIVRNMQYGDIGKVAMGRAGRIVVNIFIILTQFGFCVSYFIFIGNTLLTIFACDAFNAIPLSNATGPNSTTADSAALITDHLTDVYPRYPNLDLQQPAPIIEGLLSNITNVTTTVVTTTKSSTTEDPYPRHKILDASTTCLPALSVFVIVPLPIFLAFSMIRHVRQMGLISVIADVSIFGGIICMLSYLAASFSLTEYSNINFSSFPVFIGSTISAYEGIGTIIPIESSMEGNRKNFGLFLHIAILGLSFILLLLGILGYLHFGKDVEQMLNLNIDTSTSVMRAISKFVDCTLLLGILLTFPLQMFPVIELIESYLFASGRPFGPKRFTSYSASSDSVEDYEETSLINDMTLQREIDVNVAIQIPKSIATWKRNTLRVILVLLAAGIAVLCRDIYAYVGAFNGAVGSTMLALVLPCLFHSLLCRQDVGYSTIVRNILIMVIGLAAGVTSVYAIIVQLMDNPL